ncbi:M16 family metallopeptidase [Alterisphingorhabdus coralli]|uniref:Insulinase family protein n=1 Tax=Alterisphingorhabdus coralli TaxID=3071408 RepID=A0AA97I278_9SPHN|nr:insulinase family protein [Parasphingorhabdus sp. SCSIO 66989]WOE76095.1 insulinase family protein [Parasphingorhabdus sp. SCSIO 66989]
MTLHPLTRAFLLPLALFAALFTNPALAQRENPLPPPEGVDNDSLPWIYQNSTVPVDTSWTWGELDNGVRYAVRNNGVPPGQATIRIRIDAGSLMEEEHERGYAHLLEHLTFRGSKYVPDGEAVRIWQRFGVTFGSDSNAETSPTHTVYKLDIPSFTIDSLDESMKILSGMIREPALTQQGLDAELPIVLAEMRDNAGIQQRIADTSRTLFFSGQRYAERSPIGKVETLNAANSKTVKAFHQKWYRPENTVIVIAGDADPGLFEELLTKYFADWDVPGETPEHPDFGEPDPNAPTTAIVAEPTLPFVINQAIIRPWNYVNDTIEYNEGLLTDLLALQIINRELERRARAGGSFLQASVSQDDIGRSVDGTFVSIVPIGEDWEAALADVRAVIERAKTIDFAERDIAREIAEFDAALQIGVETYETEAATKQADNIISAVDIREATATPQVALDVFAGIRDTLTPQRIRQSVNSLFSGTVTRAFMIAPREIPGVEQELASALVRPIDGSALAERRANVSFDDLPDLGAPGMVATREDLRLLGMEMVTFSNGVRALIYPNDAEANKVSVRVRFGNGYQAFRNDEPSLLWSGEAALVSSGIGDLGQEELDQITTGRRIGFDFGVDDDAFEFDADTRAEDLLDQLKLFAAKLAEPGWDEAPIVRAKAGSKLSYQSYLGSPASMIDRDLSWLLHGRDPRYKTPDPDEIDVLNPESFRKTWEPILKQGPIEVMLFGDFDRETAIGYLAQTLGALEPRKSATPGPDNGIPAMGVDRGKPVVTRHSGDADQAAAVIAWPTSGGLDDVRESRQLEILAAMFNNRLFEQLREKSGTSYAPQVFSNWPYGHDNGGYVAAITQLAPSGIALFEEIAKSIASDLAQNPVDLDELSRAVEPLSQRIRRAATGNQFWMWQLEGATRDRRRIRAVRTLLSDYTDTSPLEMQLLAQKYLADAPALRWHVLPGANGNIGD